MNEIIPGQGENQNLPAEINIDTLKSVYYWINAKPDTHIKVFKQSKLVSFSDIIVLNGKVQQKLENHELFTNVTSITLTFEDGEIKSFNAWEVFKNHPWEVPNKTESITINWDITVQLPNYKLPQKHTLKVRIGSSLRPNEIFQIMTNGDDDIELHENMAFMVCKVDFINVVLSKELISIISEWYNILPSIQPKSKIQQFVEKYKREIARVGHYLTTFTGLVILFFIFKLHTRTLEVKAFDINLYRDIYFWIICLFIAYFISNLFGTSFGQYIFNKVNSYKESHIFKITSGDKNEQDELERKNRKVSSNLIWQFIIRLLVSLISIFVTKVLLKN